jgi:carbonic anhydrase
MHRRQALKLFAGMALCRLCASASRGLEADHWSYGGGTGPDKWGSLDARRSTMRVRTSSSEPISV